MIYRAFLVLTACFVCLVLGWDFGRAVHMPGRDTRAGAGSEAQNLAETIADASFVTSVIVQLNSGNTQSAENLLRLRQDGDILVIHDLLGFGNNPTRRAATNLLAGIAKHRASQPPFNYSARLPQADRESVAKVESVLKKY